MELYQLSAFAAVAEEGSVTRAAERLFTSQPAVSAQLKALEQELGVELFQRLPNGMKLTEAGRQLLPQARQMLTQSHTLLGMARQLRDGLTGTLRVGVNNVSDLFPLHDIVERLTAAHPRLTLQLNNGASGAILKGVKSYDLDAGFFEGPINDAAVTHLTLDRTPLRIIAPAGWADELPEGDWAALQRRPWVFVSPDCSYCRLIENIAREHSLTLQKQFRVDECRSALGFVRRGMAMSLADQRVVQPYVDAGEIVFWPGFSAKLPQSLIALSTRADEPAVAALFQACAACFHINTTPTVPAAD